MMLAAVSTDDGRRTAGAAKGGDGRPGRAGWVRCGDGGGDAARQVDGAGERVGGDAGGDASIDGGDTIYSRTGAEAEVGVSGVGSRVARCGGTTGGAVL